MMSHRSPPSLVGSARPARLNDRPLYRLTPASRSGTPTTQSSQSPPPPPRAAPTPSAPEGVALQAGLDDAVGLPPGLGLQAGLAPLQTPPLSRLLLLPQLPAHLLTHHLLQERTQDTPPLYSVTHLHLYTVLQEPSPPAPLQNHHTGDGSYGNYHLGSWMAFFSGSSLMLLTLVGHTHPPDVLCGCACQRVRVVWLCASACACQRVVWLCVSACCVVVRVSVCVSACCMVVRVVSVATHGRYGGAAAHAAHGALAVRSPAVLVQVQQTVCVPAGGRHTGQHSDATATITVDGEHGPHAPNTRRSVWVTSGY